MKRVILSSALAAAVMASPAMAHTGLGMAGLGTASGFMAGFGHPIGGLDHVLAMVAVGILAVQMGGRAVWQIPSTFVAMMIFGGFLGISAIAVPFVEQGILGSVMILGAVVAMGRKLPVGLAASMVGVLAVFHGHAHGTEMPLDASGLEYGIGFALATAMLHGAGIALSMVSQKIAARVAPMAVRVSGAAISIGGVALAVA